VPQPTSRTFDPGESWRLRLRAKKPVSARAMNAGRGRLRVDEHAEDAVVDVVAAAPVSGGEIVFAPEQVVPGEGANQVLVVGSAGLGHGPCSRSFGGEGGT
jgi:hypothetical protein